jgi:hypothetical protein
MLMVADLNVRMGGLGWWRRYNKVFDKLSVIDEVINADRHMLRLCHSSTFSYELNFVGSESGAKGVARDRFRWRALW